MIVPVYMCENMYGQRMATLDPRGDVKVGTCELPKGFELGQNMFGQTFAYRNDGMAFALRRAGDQYCLAAQGGGTYDEHDAYTVFVKVTFDE